MLGTVSGIVRPRLRTCRMDGDALAEDVACERCGYNLRMLQASATCPECGHSIASSIAAHDECKVRFTLANMRPVERAGYALFGIVLPALCFAMAFAFSGPIGTDRLEDVAMRMLTPIGTWPFYPLIGFAMFSLAAVLYRPAAAAQRPALRVGVLSGLPLSAQYVIIESVALLEGNVQFVAVMLILGGGLATTTIERRGAQRLRRRMILDSRLVVGALAVSLLVLTGLLAPVALLAMLALILVAAPVWALLTYGFVSVRLLRTIAISTAPCAERKPVLAWCAVYALAWIAAGVGVTG